MKRDAMRANWRMLCSSASIVAPASSKHAGFPFVVGNIPQSAGRSIPRMRPRTSSAAAIVAPVLPAETTASASPCLTIAVATPIDVSARRRRAVAGCSSIPTTSCAGRIVIPGGTSAPRALRIWSSRPTSTRSDGPPSFRYNKAPRTISSGAWSPPIASTAIFIRARPYLGRRPSGLDRNDLAAAEHPAMRAGLVRRLGVLALRTRNEVHRAQREMAATLALRRTRYPFLGLACQSVLLVGGFDDSSGRNDRTDVAGRGLRRFSGGDRAPNPALAIRGSAHRACRRLRRSLPDGRHRRHLRLPASRQALRSRVHRDVRDRRPALVGARARHRPGAVRVPHDRRGRIRDHRSARAVAALPECLRVLVRGGRRSTPLPA